MNKLLTFSGAQPIYLGDIDFLQDASAQMETCLARALMGDGSNTLNAILQGVEFSYGSGLISWTAGVVVLNGEILPIAAGSISGAQGDLIYFHVSSVLSGNRIFKDGESHQCWDTRTATISKTAQGGIPVSSTPRYTRDDYYKWNGDITSDYITNASLIRKNGLYFIDLQLTLPSTVEAGSLGTVDFDGLSASDISAITNVPFYQLMFIEANDPDPLLKIAPEVLEFLSTGNGSVQLTVAQGDTRYQVAGSAFIRAQVPLT